MDILLILGFFVFSSNFRFETLNIEKSYNHAEISRYKNIPALQFLGADNEILTIGGTSHAELNNGELGLFILEMMAESGLAFPLFSSNFIPLGNYVITNLSIKKRVFDKNGNALAIDFEITLKQTSSIISSLELSEFLWI